MEAAQLDLKGLHLPDPISWWPPAIGWWLMGLGIIILTVLLFWVIKRVTRKTAVKKAKVILLAIKNNSELDNAQKLCELSILIRRVAISIAPRTDVASLTGSAWLSFLDSHLKNSPFSTGVGVKLAYAPYQPTLVTESEILQLISLCEEWLKHCNQAKLKRPNPLKKVL